MQARRWIQAMALVLAVLLLPAFTLGAMLPNATGSGALVFQDATPVPIPTLLPVTATQMALDDSVVAAEIDAIMQDSDLSPEERLDQLRALIEKYPESTQVYLARGILHNIQGEYGQAIADYDQAILMDSTDADFYFYRGSVYARLSNEEKAIENYDQVIALDPTYTRIFYTRGLNYAVLGNLDRAIEDFDQAVILDPMDVEVFYIRGLTYMMKADFEQAVLDFNQVIALAPQYAPAFYERGNAYRNLNNLEHAAADYTQAISLDPTFGAAYVNRGIVYGSWNDMKNAINDYNQAITLSPNYAPAFYNRGAAYWALGLGESDSSQQTSYFQKAVSDFQLAEALGYDLPVLVQTFIHLNQVKVTPTPGS